jgi:hypothetical protein
LNLSSGLPSALLQDGPGTPSQVTSLAEELRAKVEKGSAECVDRSGMLRAGGSRFRRDESGVTRKPVTEIRASEDEDSDRHIEEDLVNRK